QTSPTTIHPQPIARSPATQAHREGEGARIGMEDPTIACAHLQPLGCRHTMNHAIYLPADPQRRLRHLPGPIDLTLEVGRWDLHLPEVGSVEFDLDAKSAGKRHSTPTL